MYQKRDTKSWATSFLLEIESVRSASYLEVVRLISSEMAIKMSRTDQVSQNTIAPRSASLVTGCR